MNDLDLASLYTQIERFLVCANTEPKVPDGPLERGRAFWSSRSHITASEVGVLAELAHTPAPLETIACRLQLDLAHTQDFLDALVFIGMLERVGVGYGATSSARGYLETFMDQSLEDVQHD